MDSTPKPDELVDAWVYYYTEAEMSIAEISRLSGVAAATVRYRLAKRGVEFRKPGSPKTRSDLKGFCKKGHDLSEWGSVQKNGKRDKGTRVVCRKCIKDRKKFMYDNDPEYRAKRIKWSREYKEKLKNVLPSD